MRRSDRDPNAIDRIRDDAIMTEASDKLQEQAARIAALEAQLAAATERERAARKLAGQWVSNYIELLIGQIEQPENEWMLEMLRPTLTQVAAALAAAQPASEPENNNG